MKEKKPKVLVVEDNVRQSKLIVDLINETNLYEVLPAYNGVEALDLLKQHRRGFDFLNNDISCILLDWQMPEMSGEQFLTRLRKSESKKPFKQFIPVVIISAYGDVERRKLAENPIFGMVSAYLTKPFEETDLINIIYRIVYLREGEVLREMLSERR